MDNAPLGMGGPANSHIKSLENWLELYLVKKAPFQLPAGFKEFLVKTAPWFSLIGLLIGLPLILAWLGLEASILNIFGNFGRYYGFGFGYYLYLILDGIIIVLEAIAIPGLFKRAAGAWRFLFYASLLQIIENVVGGNIVSALVTGLISLYFLFQVKEYYK